MADHLKVTVKQTAHNQTNTVPVLADGFCHVKPHAADQVKPSVLLLVRCDGQVAKFPKLAITANKKSGWRNHNSFKTPGLTTVSTSTGTSSTAALEEEVIATPTGTRRQICACYNHDRG